MLLRTHNQSRNAIHHACLGEAVLGLEGLAQDGCAGYVRRVWITDFMPCFSTPHRDQANKLRLREGKVKDASSVPADPAGKRQHVVEIANFVDAGTSIWLHRQVGADFDAETLLEVVAQFFREHGLPALFTFDNCKPQESSRQHRQECLSL